MYVESVVVERFKHPLNFGNQFSFLLRNSYNELKLQKRTPNEFSNLIIIPICTLLILLYPKYDFLRNRGTHSHLVLGQAPPPHKIKRAHIVFTQ